MVKAELKYNPYILDTQITFNGSEPRVNSMVEKYKDGLLADWVDKIPNIFYNELNGYDFDLEFTGTKFDYDKLHLAFEENGISKDEVRLFHISELASRTDKLEKIDALVEWLRNNINDSFNVDSFFKDNTALFNESYPFIVIQDQKEKYPKVELQDVSVEVINDCKELSNTDLNHTPIVFRINKDNLNNLIFNLRSLIARNDVCEKQLFFLTDETIKEAEFNHFFKELGMNKPNIIKAFDDTKIEDYMNSYPISDFIYDAINVFRDAVISLSKKNEEKDKQNKKTHSNVRREISKIDKEITAMKESAALFEVQKNLAPISAFDDRKEKLISQIMLWNKRRTVISNTHDAEKLSDEFMKICERSFNAFVSDVSEIGSEKKNMISEEMKVNYGISGVDDKFIPKSSLGEVEKTSIPNLKDDFLNLKEEKWVQVNKGGIFQSKNDSEMVMETIYYYQEWREHASEIIKKLANDVVNNHYNVLNEYFDNTRKEYFEHLKTEIENKTKERTAIAKKLSAEEKKIQMDMEWLEQFKDKITMIERG